MFGPLKNHGCRQKIPDGTSSAMFNVRTIAKCCEFKRCTSTRFDVTQVTVLINCDKHGCFSWENVFRPPQKPWLPYGQKKTEGTSPAIFEIGTAAKCCELKSCADPVRSTEPTTKMKSLKVT